MFVRLISYIDFSYPKNADTIFIVCVLTSMVLVLFCKYTIGANALNISFIILFYRLVKSYFNQVFYCLTVENQETDTSCSSCIFL